MFRIAMYMEYVYGASIYSNIQIVDDAILWHMLVLVFGRYKCLSNLLCRAAWESSFSFFWWAWHLRNDKITLQKLLLLARLILIQGVHPCIPTRLWQSILMMGKHSPKGLSTIANAMERACAAISFGNLQV